jgi:hypothetical protein
MITKRTVRGWSSITTFVVLLLLAVTPAFAQFTSVILGTVTDTSGGVIAGARVTVTDEDTAQTRTVMTSSDGTYRVPALRTGHYKVKFEAEGFKVETRQGLTLDVAQELPVNVSLQVGASAQEVTVTGGETQIQTTSSSLSGLVNERQMADLPLNGRNYINLTLMLPGVAQNLNNSSLGGMSGTVFSSNGAPTMSNAFLLDGTSLVNQSGWGAASMAGTTLGVDGIQEFKVITSGFSAEYGMAMGSQMVMVSRGGTNHFHGDVYDYLRNSALNARNYFDPATIPGFQKNNFGGSFGGPIKKDKTFFYAVYEALRVNLGFTVADVVPAAGCHGVAGAVITSTACPQLGSVPSVTIVNSQIAALLALYPNPTGGTDKAPSFSFKTPDTQSVNYGQIRVDHNFSATDALFGRYTIDQSLVSDPTAGFSTTAFTGVAFPQWRGEGGNQDSFLTVAENHIFSSALLNSARISFSRTNFYTLPLTLDPLTGVAPFQAGGNPGSVAITGLSGFGQSSTQPTTHLQNIYSFADDLSYLRGKHALKFGTLINRYNSAITNSSSALGGSISYASLANFLLGEPATYGATSPGSNLNRDFIYNTLGFYAQDDWRVKSRLTLNIGLRYEIFTTPWELSNKGWAIRDYGLAPTPTQGAVMTNKSYLNFSPRFGFAWDVFGDGKTSVRGSAAILYDVGDYGNAFTWNAVAQPPISGSSSVSTSNTVITFPFSFPPSAAGHTVGTNAYNVNQPRVQQFNLSVQRQLPKDIALTVAYVHSRGVHLWAEKHWNLVTPTFGSPGTKEYWSDNIVSANGTAGCGFVVPSCRMNPNYDDYMYDTTDGDSWYDGLQVNVVKKLSRGLEFQGAYTYSHALDSTNGQLNGSDCTSPGMNEATDPAHLRTDYGPACYDLRHNLRFNLLYHLPTVKTDNFLVSKLANGWWVANIVSVQGGYPFSTILSANRSNNSLIGVVSATDRTDVGTMTVAPGQSVTDPDGTVTTNTTNDTFIPYNPKTVIEGKPQQWFNPLMFSMQPMVACPNIPTQICGVLGDESRGLLRGPGLGTWDFSLVKDTAVPFLGEAGMFEFRAEFFNLLNRSNFSMPSGTVFSGLTKDIGPYSEAPLSNAGQITTTSTTSRQIQFALKLIF